MFSGWNKKESECQKQDDTLLCNLAYIYLYIPVVLFLVTWLRQEIALVTVGLLVVVFWKNGVFKWRKTKRVIDNSWEFCFVAILFLGWCVISGQGAFVGQPFDWEKHNAIFQDLINNSWPVHYSMGKENGIMSYYIAEYLVPAVAGKMFGLHFGEVIMLLQVFLGVVLLFLCLVQFLGCNKKGNYIQLAVIMILFGTFMYTFRIIYGILCPEDVGMHHRLSEAIGIQYSTHVVLLRWVFPQCVPTWLATLLLLMKQKEKRSWAMICAPLFLYSTFAFLGIIIVVVLSLLFEIALKKNGKEVLKDIFSVENMLVVISFVPILIYIAGNVLQPKPDDVGMKFGLIDYSEHILVLLLFESAWLFWVAFIWRQERYNHYLHAGVVVLFLLPLFQYGIYNDLCMRSSIPALFILFVFVAKSVFDENKSLKYRKILFTLIVINALHWDGGILEPFVELSVNGIHKDNRCVSEYEEEYGTSLFTGGEFNVMKYQYVNWNYKEDLNRYILK